MVKMQGRLDINVFLKISNEIVIIKHYYPLGVKEIIGAGTFSLLEQSMSLLFSNNPSCLATTWGSWRSKENEAIGATII